MKLDIKTLQSHPAVHVTAPLPSRKLSGKWVSMVHVTCPGCSYSRDVIASFVVKAIQTKTFTGFCAKCAAKARRGNGKGGRKALTGHDIPHHSAISIADPPEQVVMYGRLNSVGTVTCPVCSKERKYPIPFLRKFAVKGFTGVCKSCINTKPMIGTFKRKAIWPAHLKAKPRQVSSGGYVILARSAIAEQDTWLFDAMVNKSQRLFEHRFVMAKHLGRPLHSYEFVDHMDGVRTNNSIKNLRIYIRGKQQPGSCPGYGTYYHEWQVAESRIRELETLLKPRKQKRA